MSRNIGIVFSGGGARTMAHLGLIKALEAENIRATHVSGTSAGAIVAALYAAGYSADEILDFFKKTVLFKISFYAMSQSGLLHTDEYSAIFKKYFVRDDFDALDKKLYVAATDILEARPRIFHEGKLIPALLASTAYPMVFEPVEIDGKWYVDGAMTNNFPVEPLRWQCDRVIGSYVTPLSPANRADLLRGNRLLQRSYDICCMINSKDKFSQCDVLIRPDALARFGFFETRHLDEMFHIGYLAAKEKMDELRTLLSGDWQEAVS